VEITLFEKYRTTGFLKKAHDGVYVVPKDNETAVCVRKTGEEELRMPCSVDKTYYEYVKSEGTGVVVGFKDVVINGYIDVDFLEEFSRGSELHFDFQSRSKETVKCAIVYYANNKKHLVPLEDICPLEHKKSKNKDDFER
jgi:hypothetical protein